VLHFPSQLANQPIVSRLVRDYALEFNILKAYIDAEEGGLLAIELSGEDKNYNKGIKYLKDVGVKIQPLSKDITRNDDRCTYCSVCVPLCPTGSFEMDAATKEVHFQDEKCVACGLCIKICPMGAMEMTL
jgi:ferredoxin